MFDVLRLWKEVGFSLVTDTKAYNNDPCSGVAFLNEERAY